MKLSQNLIDKGFHLSAVNPSDLDDYISVKKHCYEKYVDEYYGGWVDDVQVGMNTSAFNQTMAQTCFQKIMFNDRIVGFWGYDELDDIIDGITIQMI